jgi:hypothetical protein
MTRAYGSGRKFITVKRPKIRFRHPGTTPLGFTCFRLVPTFDQRRDPGASPFAVMRVGPTTNSMAAFRLAR